MDGDPGNLRESFLHVVFKSRQDIMNAGNGEVIFHDAVAGDQDVVFDLADANIMTVDELVVGRGHVIEKGFDGHFKLAHFAGTSVGCGDMTAEGLDVDIDVYVAIAQGADAVFELGGAAVGFAERKILIHLEMELDKHMVVLL